MKRFALIGLIVIAVAALVFLERGIGQNAQSDSDADSQTSQSAQKTPPKPSATSAVPGAATALPPEQIINDPAKAKYVVRVGWIYNSANQVDSTALVNALKPVQMLSKASHGRIAAEIVDLDIPVSERSKEAQSVSQLGVVMTGPIPGGKPIVMNGNPGEGSVVGQRIYSTLTSLPM